jgi:hypothetical protein
MGFAFATTRTTVSGISLPAIRVIVGLRSSKSVYVAPDDSGVLILCRLSILLYRQFVHVIGRHARRGTI